VFQCNMCSVSVLSVTWVVCESYVGSV